MYADASGSRSLSLFLSLSPSFSLSLFEQLWLLITFLKITALPLSFPSSRGLAALITRPLLCPHLFLVSLVSRKRLPCYRLTRTLRHLLLQGLILPAQGPRHPRPVSLVNAGGSESEYTSSDNARDSLQKVDKLSVADATFENERSASLPPKPEEPDILSGLTELAKIHMIWPKPKS